MTITLEVRITGIDRLTQRYSRRRINSASHAGLESALFQVEAEAKDSATQIIYSRPESRPSRAAAAKVIKSSKPKARRAVSAIARNTGRRTGAYRASLTRGGSGNVRRLSGDSGSFGSRLSYAATIEDGSKPHIIRPRRRKALAFMAGGQMVVRKSVNHPGTKPRRVLQTAARNGRKRIAEAYARAFWRSLGAA